MSGANYYYCIFIFIIILLNHVNIFAADGNITTTTTTTTTSLIINSLVTDTSTSTTATTTTTTKSVITSRTYNVVSCKTSADCPVTLTCVSRVCLLVQAITTSKTTHSSITDSNSDYSPLNEVIVNPLLWTLIIGLPLIIIIVIVIVLVIYCRHSCHLTALRRRRTRHVVSPNIVLNTSVSVTSQIYSSDDTVSIDTLPPLYKDVTCINPNGGEVDLNANSDSSHQQIESKDLFNISIEQLPTYSSWSKKHQPDV